MSLTIFQPDDQDATELIPAGPVLPDFSTIDPMELARFLDHVTRPKHLGGAGWAVTQVAEKCGKSEVWVRDWRRMVMLPEVWQQRLSSGEISQTKALYLLTFNAATIAAFDREFTADPSLFRNRRDFNKRLEAIATHLMPRAVASDKKAVETPLTRRLRNALAKCEAEPDKPSYRLHKHSGQAVVRINSKDHYLGRYGSSESYRLYDELIESYRRGKSVEGVRVTVGELALRYLDYAQKRYTKGGAPTSHAVQIGNALQYAVDEFGKIRAADFSPLKLKAIRDKVAAKCVRTTANKYSRLIVGMFEWAVAEELLPESVYVSLRTMKPLRRGEARANPPVAPVPMEHVTAVKPYVHPSVWGMIQVQLLSAARPGEVRPMRLCDIQTEGGVWVYTPPTHKTDYTGAERPILLGPKAQGVIREFATEDRCAYLFPPPSGYTGSKFYSGDGYANAIRVACKKAGVPRWHPHQLRHNAATLIRQEFDVETAATILGHRDLSTTEIYAERNLKGALTAMEKIG